MTNNIAFKTQIASIMEVLANAAVAEICKLLDDDYAVLRVEISQSHNENRTLKRKLQTLELKMARERAERTIRERVPNARSGGRTSVMERNRGWRGGGNFVIRDRFLASQGESSWRGRRCFTEDPPTKRTSEMEEPTVIELEDPVVQIKQEIPEAVLHEPEETSWKRVLGPVCDGMVSHTVNAEPLASPAEQTGSRENVVEAVKADLDLPLSKMEGRDERQVDAASSFSLTGFKESELTINNTMFTSSSREELSVPPPMEHRAFSSVVKMEFEDANLCAELNGPSTSAGHWSGTVGVEWNSGMASGQTEDHGSTSNTLETRLGIFPSDQNQEVQEMLERQWSWQKPYPATTGKERTRRYRERIKADQHRREELRRERRRKYLEKKANGDIKPRSIQHLPEERRQQLREQWRASKARCRRRKQPHGVPLYINTMSLPYGAPE
ncbi:uncharacterized protein LOC122130933 isoform X3 [Clupea harengus]|uniref:Uncharacterized protein LOC122130933 isoform X3 n=1 Tax=Clupea harengus TaxID=7950 RepID=A0A8M1KIU3_CLUHA|nr:uncharacterized protein LOC122130933 isoform X3 [Clupea harengus]